MFFFVEFERFCIVRRSVSVGLPLERGGHGVREVGVIHPTHQLIFNQKANLIRPLPAQPTNRHTHAHGT